MVTMEDFVEGRMSQGYDQYQRKEQKRSLHKSNELHIKRNFSNKSGKKSQADEQGAAVPKPQGIPSAAPKGPNQPLNRSPFDSDYAGSEATFTTRSFVQIPDGQVKAHVLHCKEPQLQLDGEEYYDEHDESDEENVENNDESDTSQESHINQAYADYCSEKEGGRHNAGDSYPSTTVGNAEPIEEGVKPAIGLDEPATHVRKYSMAQPQHLNQGAPARSEHRNQYLQSTRLHTTRSMPTASSAELHQHYASRTSIPPTITTAYHQRHSSQRQVDNRIVPNDGYAVQVTPKMDQIDPALQAGGYHNEKATPNPRAMAREMPTPRPTNLEQLVRSDDNLDYDVQTLKKMSYDELEKQPFDFEPLKADAVLSETDKEKSVAERMVLVQSLRQHEKKAFLSSLTLDEWEEAGDWFLGRFGDLAGKIREVRKERRKLAAGLEDEVLKRHEHVQGKKRNIEDALEAMSKSGATVLRAGTPSKKRKS